MGRDRGQLIIIGLLFLFLIILTIFGIELLFSNLISNPPVHGEPKKDPATGLYTVYILVGGHRDLTILHRNLHANIHIDYVSFYFESPQDLPPGSSILDFSKSIHVIVSVTDIKLGTQRVGTVDARVSLAARWGRAIVYTLPPGTYMIEALGVDKDGFQSSSTARLVLP